VLNTIKSPDFFFDFALIMWAQNNISAVLDYSTLSFRPLKKSPFHNCVMHSIESFSAFLCIMANGSFILTIWFKLNC
jgi:hypothetical protein